MEGQERLQSKKFKSQKATVKPGRGTISREKFLRQEEGETAWHYFLYKSLSSMSSFRRLWVKREATG